MKRSEVPAVTETEFLSILESFNLKDDFMNNRLLCSRCGKAVSLGNLLGYTTKDGSLLLICNDINCKESTNE